MTYISWFIDIGLYLEDYLTYKAVTLAGGIREPLLTCSSFYIGVGVGVTLIVLRQSFFYFMGQAWRKELSCKWTGLVFFKVME